jgi:hypothetical protein
MQTNGKWAVIDRNMPQCVPLWPAMKVERAGLAATLVDSEGIDLADALKMIDEFRTMAQKIWHLYVLNLPRMCESLNLQEKHLLTQCGRVDHIRDPVDHVSIDEILSLWEGLSRQAGEDQKKRQQCEALDYCNYAKAQPQGECLWREIPDTRMQFASCSCFQYFAGETCQTRIPEKNCTVTKVNTCTAHPISWYQDDCSDFGSDWKYDTWQYCGFIHGFGGQYVCKKEWTCQPLTLDDDCCSED